jgi:anthranilate phosphoribosyltransferase
VRRQVIGVAKTAFAERMIETLKSHGSRRAWVVHGGDLDELSTTDRSDVIELDHGVVRHFRVDPQEFGLARVRDDDLVGGEPSENAEFVRRVLAGERGPHRDIVLLNAGAGLVVAGRAVDLADGLAVAERAIDSGAAAATLERFVAASREAAG